MLKILAEPPAMGTPLREVGYAKKQTFLFLFFNKKVRFSYTEKCTIYICIQENNTVWKYFYYIDM